MTAYFFSDICGTLYRVNTSYSFLAYYFNRNNKAKGVYFRLLLSLPAKVLWKILGGIMDMEWLRNHLLGLLKGEEENKVESEARSFAREVLPLLENKAAWERVKSGFPLVLVSATLSPLAKAIAENIGAEAFFATQMEVKDGIFTGKVESDGRNKKLELLSQSKYGPYLSSSSFMTDNKGDLPLVKTVKEAIVITKISKHQRFWLKQNMPNLKFLKV